MPCGNLVMSKKIRKADESGTVLSVPLRLQMRHMAAKTVDSISMFLMPASWAFIKYSSFSSVENEHRAPSSLPWPVVEQVMSEMTRKCHKLGVLKYWYNQPYTEWHIMANTNGQYTVFVYCIL